MAQVKVGSSKAPCVAMLGGMLLLGLAGTLVVMTPSPYLADLQKEGAAAARRLSDPAADAAAAAAATATATADAQAQTTRQMYVKAAGASWGSIATQVIISLCFAFLYEKNTVTEILEKKGGTLKENWNYKSEGEDDFENHICGCMNDPWVLIHGLCCPLVRMAHTNAVSGIMGYWETVLVWFCCALFTGSLGNCCLMVYWRKQLKGIMGIDDNLLCDVCVTCLVPSLAVCQQGSAVDAALGYEVVGCCDLEWNDGCD